jgi:hypothetical protein
MVLTFPHKGMGALVRRARDLLFDSLGVEVQAVLLVRNRNVSGQPALQQGIEPILLARSLTT